MIAAIHQPHYFPWLGYFDKMAKSDVFILMDEVQLEKGSYMYRNRILNAQGKITFLTISADKHGYLSRKYCELTTTNDEHWLEMHRNEIKRAYQDSPFFEEVWNELRDLFETREQTICQYCIRSVIRLKTLLGIPTKIVLQSELEFDDEKRKNDLVLNLCQAVAADGYLSGNGARKYTDESAFESAGIRLRYQNFSSPVYAQLHTDSHVPGLSTLDILFNCGIAETKALFWQAVENGNEFSDEERSV